MIKKQRMYWANGRRIVIKKERVFTLANFDPLRTLTIRERNFVRQYPVDLNGTKSAIRAGYSKKGAGQQACALLNKIKIKRALAYVIQQRAKRTNITADKVLKEIGILAFSNMAEVAEWGTDEWNNDWLSIYPSDQLTEDQQKMIKSIKFKEVPTNFGVRKSVEVQLHDKGKYVQLAAKHTDVGEDKLKIEHDVKGGVLVVPGVMEKGAWGDLANRYVLDKIDVKPKLREIDL